MQTLPKLNYTKGHSNGNDFILFEDTQNRFNLTPKQTKLICNRNKGIGADGIIRATQTTHTNKKLWFMDYRNQDGSLANMCGNGLRVFVEFLRNKKLISTTTGNTVLIDTRAGIKQVEITTNGYKVDMGTWCLPENLATTKTSCTITNLNTNYPALSVNTGNLHTVTFLQKNQSLQQLNLSNKPKVHSPGEPNSNIEFATKPTIENNVIEIAARVYENGVGETLSCGTGTCAIAIAAKHLFPEISKHKIWHILLPGGPLKVEFKFTNNEEHVFLSGNATLISEGTLL